MSRFAADRRTFFFEEPIFDSGEPELELRPVMEKLVVAVPHLPAGTTAQQGIIAQRALLDRMLADYDVHAPVLWFYTPMALPIAGHIGALVTIYDCMDELSAFDAAPPELGALERELFARADLVFTGGQSLYEAKRAQHANVHAFPSSVDSAHFARARGPIADPVDQASIPRPRLGYFGVIDERMDLELVASIADASPAFHVVMVGPVVKIDPTTLPVRPNIHYLGQKSYADLPSYLAGWEVALMPFALNASTRFISPTKTLEYLAAGKPVVSTAIRDVVSPYGARGLVRIGDRTTFVEEIAGALAEDPTARRAAADAFVAMTSWDETFLRMARLIEGVAAAKSHHVEGEETSHV